MYATKEQVKTAIDSMDALDIVKLGAIVRWLFDVLEARGMLDNVPWPPNSIGDLSQDKSV